MNLLPVQVSELTIGQPLLWDLFNQDHKQLLARGDVLSNADEQLLLKKSPLFRLQEEETTKEKIVPINTDTKKQSPFNFQDMKLKVGDKLQLKLPSNLTDKYCIANGGFYTTELIGYVNNVTLIISMPKSAQLIDLPLIEGDQVTIRLFSGQYAFSFSSYIDKVIKIPFKYTHLSFPTKIFGQIIRKSRRIKTNIVASVADHTMPATISNLSMTGAELRANTNLGQLGEIIALSFTLTIHNIEKSLSLQAIIRSIKPLTNDAEDTLNFGIEFQALESEQNFALQSLIYQELVEHPESQA